MSGVHIPLVLLSAAHARAIHGALADEAANGGFDDDPALLAAVKVLEVALSLGADMVEVDLDDAVRLRRALDNDARANDTLALAAYEQLAQSIAKQSK